jgi:hypothetical protein
VLVPQAQQLSEWEMLVGGAQNFTRFHSIAPAEAICAPALQARTSFTPRSLIYSPLRMIASCYPSCLTTPSRQKWVPLGLPSSRK